MVGSESATSESRLWVLLVVWVSLICGIRGPSGPPELALQDERRLTFLIYQSVIIFISEDSVSVQCLAEFLAHKNHLLFSPRRKLTFSFSVP